MGLTFSGIKEQLRIDVRSMDIFGSLWFCEKYDCPELHLPIYVNMTLRDETFDIDALYEYLVLKREVL